MSQDDSQGRGEMVAMLRAELAREDLSVYTVCVLALRDLDRGDLDRAIARLRVDADKLRTYDTPINNLIN